jgi:phosphate transport system substrate-binding protein
LFFYVKKAHIAAIPGIDNYLAEFTSEAAMGDEGYLVDKGLIPLSAEKREELRASIKNGKTLSM